MEIISFKAQAMKELILCFIFGLATLKIVYSDADLTLCKWRNINGICIPTEDCFGECTKSQSCNKDICCLYPSIVQEKCTKYKQEVYMKSCATGKLYSTGTKIVGGEVVKKNEFPHMAAIGLQRGPEDKIDWVCGGTVISPDFILSAAHCFNQKVIRTWILVGTNRLDDPHGIKREVSKVIKHPKYQSWSLSYDIALLKLESPLNFSPHVHPACLLYEHEQQHLQTSIATGWGKINEDDEGVTNDLRKVKLRVIYLSECGKYHPTLVHYNSLQPSMICAGYLPGGKDTCQGDSGGPLVIAMKDTPSFYGLVGLTSASSFGCGTANTPSIYTRISYYLTWIVETVWSNEL